MFFLMAPFAPQALKKDEGVPWTGMLAIVHSYVTHKTGKMSLGVGKDPCIHMDLGGPGQVQVLLGQSADRGG